MRAPAAAVTRTLYRELLRSGRRIDRVTRAEHAPVISELVGRFADEQSVAVQHAIQQHEQLPIADLVRHTFRDLQRCSGANESCDLAADSGFRALRTIGLIEQFVHVDHVIHTHHRNAGAESVSAEPRARLLADAIMARA